MSTIKEWLAKRWMWVAGILAGLVALAVARSQGKKVGRLEMVEKDMRKTLNEVDANRKKLVALSKERVDLAAQIAKEAAKRTKALEEDLSEEEVLRRLREKGLVK